MTSEARPRDDEAQDVAPVVPSGKDAAARPGAAAPGPTDGEPAEQEPSEEGATEQGPAEQEPPAAAGTGARTRRGRGRDGGRDGGEARTGSRLSIPLVPTLLLVLVLLLGATAFLWFTRPGESPVRTAEYVGALQAARSGVVDLTSFDYLTLDDDIEQIRRVATGELRDEAVAELDASRQQITDAEAVVNTEVVGGGVTRATDSDATVWLVIESTQESNTSPQAQVVRYRIEVELERPEDRWLLSGIKGTGTENE